MFFLNHGSFGACPKVIFEEYQTWQRKIEFQPVEFFTKTLIPELNKARQILADFVFTDAENLLLVRNATYAANIVIRSLDLKKNDEIVLTNHEYGACRNAWDFWQKEKGFTLQIWQIDLPLPSHEELLSQLDKLLTQNTKAVFFSHISSFTAQCFPAAEICRHLKNKGILSIVDGAHTVGQLDINLAEIEADFYFSNLHKWLFAPKGTAFLYTNPQYHSLIKPLITGWGWGSMSDMRWGSDYIDSNQFYGTADYSSFLCIPAAINFFKANNISELRSNCIDLVSYFLQESLSITGKSSLYSENQQNIQMGVIEVPAKYPAKILKAKLYQEYKIEIPVIEWENRLLIRISVQVYNTVNEIEYLLDVLWKIFNK